MRQKEKEITFGLCGEEISLSFSFYQSYPFARFPSQSHPGVIIPADLFGVFALPGLRMLSPVGYGTCRFLHNQGPQS